MVGNETIMIFIDNQIDLKKLCRIKKKSKSKACLEHILWAFFFFMMTSSRYICQKTGFVFLYFPTKVIILDW